MKQKPLDERIEELMREKSKPKPIPKVNPIPEQPSPEPSIEPKINRSNSILDTISNNLPTSKELLTGASIAVASVLIGAGIYFKDDLVDFYKSESEIEEVEPRIPITKDPILKEVIEPSYFYVQVGPVSSKILDNPISSDGKVVLDNGAIVDGIHLNMDADSEPEFYILDSKYEGLITSLYNSDDEKSASQNIEDTVNNIEETSSESGENLTVDSPETKVFNLKKPSTSTTPIEFHYIGSDIVYTKYSSPRKVTYTDSESGNYVISNGDLKKETLSIHDPEYGVRVNSRFFLNAILSSYEGIYNSADGLTSSGKRMFEPWDSMDFGVPIEKPKFLSEKLRWYLSEAKKSYPEHFFEGYSSNITKDVTEELGISTEDFNQMLSFDQNFDTLN